MALSIWSGMEVHASEPLQHLKEEPRLFEPADGVVEVEPLQHFAHVIAEARDVVPQVGGHVRGIRQESLEIVLGGIVEREPRRTAELSVQVFEPPAFQFGLPLKYVLPGGSQDAIEPSQHGQRQNDILVLATLERVAYQVGDTPYEADYLAMVHYPTTLPDLAVERQSPCHDHPRGEDSSHPQPHLRPDARPCVASQASCELPSLRFCQIGDPSSPSP